MSSIIQQRGSEYSNYMTALLGQYKGNLPLLIDDCNKELFLARRTQTDNWFKAIPIKKIEIGKFYLLNYNFNENKLYVPLFTIDYRVRDNKHIIYAINLDTLPFSYKQIFFQQIYNKGKQIFEKNGDANSVLEENKITVNFEGMYNALKSNGNMNYSISAYDLNKITEVFAVSTNMMHVITNCHMRKVNIALMRQQADTYDKGSELNEKLEMLVNELEQMVEDFDTDVIDYYKKLKSLENNYKLFDNP